MSEQYEHDLAVELRAVKMENTRLSEALKAVDDHGRALSFIETLKAKEAENARLKSIVKELVEWIEECGEATARTEPMLERARKGQR